MMREYIFKSKTDGRIIGYTSAETLAKAKYKIWVKCACDYYENFKHFLIDVDVRYIKKEV